MDKKIKITITDRKEIFKSHHRKEKGFDSSYTAIDSDFKTIVDCRIYFSSGYSTCYCCLWIRSKEQSKSGTGSAGGGGYHKQSASVSSAIYNAGIDMNVNISGVGDRAIEDCLIAIAKKVSGKKKIGLIHSHA